MNSKRNSVRVTILNEDYNIRSDASVEHTRQVVKITGAAAPIREQHDGNSGPVKGAFERRAADFDISVLLQSHSPASRLTLRA